MKRPFNGQGHLHMLEYCCLAAAITLPLVFNPWGSDLFELPRSLIIITLSVPLAALILYHLAAEGRDRTAPPLLRLSLLGLVLSWTTATILAPSLADSLLGSSARNQGLLTALGYLALMGGAALYLRDTIVLRRLFQVLTWTSLPLCFLGLLQVAGLNPLDWRTDSGSLVMATLGRSNFFGAYLVLLLPLSLSLVLTEKNRWPRTLLLALLVLQLACLALTRARSSWIGLAAAGLAWLSLGRVSPKHVPRRPWFLLFVVLAAAAWFTAGLLSGPLGFAPPVGFSELATRILARGGSNAARLTIWQRSVELILQRPWTGYGFDTMETVFSHVFPPELVYYQGRNVMVDRAHNLWLDSAMTSGLPGLFFLVVLLCLACSRIHHDLRTDGDHDSRLLRLGLAAALAGHLADLQFSFDLCTTAAIFWTLVGAVFARLDPGAPGRSAAGAPLFRPVPALVCLLFVLLVFAAGPLRLLQADILYARAQQEKRPIEERYQDMAEAVELAPLRVEYHLYQALLTAAGDDPTAAEPGLRAAWRLRPGDPWIMVSRGNLYALYGRNTARSLALAEKSFQEAVRLAPDIGTFHTGLASILSRQGRVYQAVAELNEALRLDATDGTAWWKLARLHELLGNREQARAADLQALQWLWHDSGRTTPWDKGTGRFRQEKARPR